MALAAVALVRLKRHMRAPLVSRHPCMILLPAELLTVTASLVKTTVHPASQNTPMLRRLLANVGMMVPELVPGGRCGKSMVAVVDECSNFPSAMPTVIGLAL